MKCPTMEFSARTRLSGLLAALTLSMLGLAFAPQAAADLDQIRALAADQHYAAALKEMDAYLESNPNDVEARLFKGVILTRQGNIDLAIATFAELAEEKPELPEPLNNLAVLYAAEGRYDESRKALLRAIELEPRYDTAHENLGDVYAKLANIAYDRAFALNEKNAGARDKANWMTRVLDTDADKPGEIPLQASSESAQPKAEVVAETKARGENSALAEQIAAACYAVNGIENQQAARSVAEWFTQRGVSASEQSRPMEGNIFYEVYVPPLKSRAEADDEIRRMRDDGFIDIMRINSGSLENGVSVGAYRQLGNAERRVKTFRDKGYQAEFKPRDKTRTAHWVAVGDGASRELRSEFTDAFPAYPLSESACR